MKSSHVKRVEYWIVLLKVKQLLLDQKKIPRIFGLSNRKSSLQNYLNHSFKIFSQRKYNFRSFPRIVTV